MSIAAAAMALGSEVGGGVGGLGGATGLGAGYTGGRRQEQLVTGAPAVAAGVEGAWGDMCACSWHGCMMTDETGRGVLWRVECMNTVAQE